MSNDNFNRGVVFGTVHEMNERKTEKNKKPYLDLVIDVSSEKYGDIRTYGRLMGADALAKFKELYAEDPKGLFRFQGLFSQYDKAGGLRQNYLFFLVARKPKETPRAAFILTGVLKEKVFGDDGMVKLVIALELPSSNSQDENEDAAGREETYQVFTEEALVESVPVFSVIQANGHLMDLDREWGGSGRVTPIVNKLRVVRAGEPF